MRQDILDEASKCVNVDRDADYGSPEDNFGRIASIWSVIFGHEVTPHQVALCMVGVKVARLVNNPKSRDGWVDIAGYAACGAECAISKSKEFPEQENKEKGGWLHAFDRSVEPDPAPVSSLTGEQLLDRFVPRLHQL